MQPGATPKLEVDGLSSPGLFADVSLAVAPGEIVGLAGLIGAGRTSVLRAIFGADPAARGTIRLDGEPVTVTSPRTAIDLGIAMVSEDRRRESLALRLDVVRNATAVLLPTTAGVLVDSGGARHLAAEGAGDVGLRGSVRRRVRQLSGGNQQKVALAKWLAVRPRVLLCDEPTRGIDVGAKAEIYGLLRRLADQGVAILFASSELPEVLGLADRIIVMHEGRIAAEFAATEADEPSIIRAASGLAGLPDGAAPGPAATGG
jgi:rhamnose transport system ATP-binding protein